MGQILRGVAARKGHAFMLVLLGTVVVAGSLTCVTYSELTGNPVGAVGALLLLGVVAVSLQAAQVAGARRQEIALAQIRGRSGLRLVAYYLAEPCSILAFATGTGIALGSFVVQEAADRWIGGDVAVSVSRVGWAAVAVAAMASLVAVAVGSWHTLHRPLLEQLDQANRPKPSTTLALFGQTAVVVGAVVATIQATQGVSVRDDWRSFASPALLAPVLLGLAAAHLASLLLALGARWVGARTAHGGRFGTFLTVRRLARRSESARGTRLVIAAAVVTAVTVNAGGSVAAWQEESTRLDVGGPSQYAVEGGGAQAYALTHRLDPEGRWLMAVVAIPDESEPYRRAFADMQRWDRVVGDFFDGTSGELSAGAIAELLSTQTDDDGPLVAVTTMGYQPDTDGGVPVAYATDGRPRPLQVADTVEAIPALGRQGILADLPRALVGSGSTVAVAEAGVVARADTPRELLAGLDALPRVSGHRDFDDVLSAASRGDDAQGVHLYGLMSGFAALVAGLSLVASVRGQRAERRREAASLRLAGVRVASIATAHGLEAAVLAGTAFVVVAVTGWVASAVSLAALSLVPQTAYTPKLDVTTRPFGLFAVAVAAGLLVGAVTYVTFHSVARRSPPRLLREQDS